MSSQLCIPVPEFRRRELRGYDAVEGPAHDPAGEGALGDAAHKEVDVAGAVVQPA